MAFFSPGIPNRRVTCGREGSEAFWLPWASTLSGFCCVAPAPLLAITPCVGLQGWQGVRWLQQPTKCPLWGGVQSTPTQDLTWELCGLLGSAAGQLFPPHTLLAINSQQGSHRVR